MSRRRRPSLAGRVARLTRRVRAIPRPEKKHWDTFGTDLAVRNDFIPASCIFPCRNITQGDSDFGERIGDKISLSSYLLNFNFNLLATISYEIVRITVLQFKHNPDGATSQSSFVNMYFNSTTDNTAYNPLALVDWDNNASFRKLFDKTYNLAGTVAVGSTPAVAQSGRKVSIRIRFPKVAKIVQYFNNGSVPCANELFVLVSSRADSTVTAQYTERLVYTDA